MRALIVGAGCCGASAARRLAEYGWQVTVVDRRDHIGGNAYDRRDENGILYHVYGPHVFFTNRKEVWDFLSPFSAWVPFRCSLRVWIEGCGYPMPFQPETLRGLLPGHADAVLAAMKRQWGERSCVTVLELLTAGDPLLRLAGQRLYDCDCVPYNQKQWGLRPDELLPEVIARAPVYLENQRDFRSEEYQFMPANGFTPLFQAMLNHPSIEVQTSVDAFDLLSVSDDRMIWKTPRQWDVVLYTGPIDRLFENRAGPLPYRTLRFDMQTRDVQAGLPCLAMYYPEMQFPWTRCTDYHYLPGNAGNSEKTLVISEHPGPVISPQDELYYVVLTEQSKEQYRRYRQMAERIPHLYAAGRLADFQYYNMDAAVERGLETAEEIHRRERGCA